MSNGVQKFWLLYLLLAVQTVGAAAEENQDQVMLLERLDELRRENRVSAVGLALVEDGQVTFSGGFGKLEHGGSRPLTQDSLFRVGSVTKSFTALALVRYRSRHETAWPPVRFHSCSSLGYAYAGWAIESLSVD